MMNKIDKIKRNASKTMTPHDDKSNKMMVSRPGLPKNLINLHDGKGSVPWHCVVVDADGSSS